MAHNAHLKVLVAVSQFWRFVPKRPGTRPFQALPRLPVSPSVPDKIMEITEDVPKFAPEQLRALSSFIMYIFGLFPICSCGQFNCRWMPRTQREIEGRERRRRPWKY